MPTITVTVVEHAATERKPWRVTAHDGTYRFTMPVIVGREREVTDTAAIRALIYGLSAVHHANPATSPWSFTPAMRTYEYVGLTKGGHRRYRVTY